MLSTDQGDCRMESVTSCVRQRSFGSDIEFCAWLRGNPNLPSRSNNIGFVATDVDLFIHNYLTAVDGQGSREIQTLMAVEVKTRGGQPRPSQLDTLAKQHLCSFRNRSVKYGSEFIRNFGVSVLSLSGTTPSDSERIRWGRFGERVLRWRDVSVTTLEDLLLCRVHPDTLDRNPFRRHHKTSSIVTPVRTELGFVVDQEVTHRS
jgi:hypothetical protein